MRKMVDNYQFSIFGKFDYISEADKERFFKLRETVESNNDILSVTQQVRFELKIRLCHNKWLILTRNSV